MSRILVVQPSKMLQQALAFALASEHQIRVADKIPEADATPEADLAIVDAAALAEREPAALRKFDVIRRWQIPVVWLGSELSALDEAAGKFVRLTPPLDRESLKRALADILGAPTHGARREPEPAPAADLKQTKPRAMDKGPGAGENNKEVIDLLEVFEEQPGHDIITDAEKKS